MKKSELKKYIKETIIAELAEDMKGAVELPPNTSPSAIKKYTDQNIDVELVKEIGTDPSASKVEDAIKSGKIDPKEVEAAAKKAMNGDSTDLALMMAGVGKMFEAKKDEDEVEDDEEKLDKKAQAAAKKDGGKVGKLQFEINGKPFDSAVNGDHEYLEQLFKHKKLIGKKATVKYFELTEDGLPRFPKVIAIRDFE